MAQPKLTKLALWGDATQYNEGRAYRHPVSGKQYPSVTTILKMVDKSGLAQWAADQAIKWATENPYTLLQKSESDGFRAGRYRWKDVANERAEVGTGVHETIEAEHTGSWAYPPLDPEQLLIMEEWRKFNEEHDVKPVHSEITVASETHGYMGTADGVWWVDGKLMLIDIKTSKGTWPEHSYQLSALYYAEEWLVEVEEMKWEVVTPQELEGAAIVHLRAPEFDDYGRVLNPGKHDLIPIKNPQLQFKAFLAYKDAWYATKEIENAEKLSLLGGF